MMTNMLLFNINNTIMINILLFDEYAAIQY